MEAKSRTEKSIKNSSVALITFFINLVLQFYSRKIFLNYLGKELLGLNSTATNLLQFINLAELGIGAAIACTLYKPISDNDKDAIINILSLQGKLYKIIALVVLVGGIIMSLFFPMIFDKMELPLWYAYASFGVLLFSSLLGYFVNYKQILLTASQQDYKIQYTYRLSMIIKVICQMGAMALFPQPYISWLILEFVFTIFSSVTLNYVIRKTFPFLKQSPLSFRQLSKQYNGIIKKVKQVFVHRVSGFALIQLTPLIIYYYANLSLVTLYTNYVMVITGFLSLLNAVFNSIIAGIGNLLSQSPEKAYVFFTELFSLRFFIASLCCFVFYLYTDNFITLWLGAGFVLPHSTLILLTVTLFISLVRQNIENYLNAYGMFYDVWAPATEMILNIICSILLGYYWGLNGVIGGTLISQILIVMIWKPYFLFSKGLQISVWKYWILFLKHLLMSVSVAVVCFFILRYIHITERGYLGLLFRLLTATLLFGGGLILIMNITKCGIIYFEKRILQFFCKRLRK